MSEPYENPDDPGVQLIDRARILLGQLRVGGAPPTNARWEVYPQSRADLVTSEHLDWWLAVGAVEFKFDMETVRDGKAHVREVRMFGVPVVSVNPPTRFSSSEPDIDPRGLLRLIVEEV